MRIAVSACLLGTPCRFDGTSKPCDPVRALRASHEVVPVCPEVAGGLRIPHPANEIVCPERALRVVDACGADNTDAFVRGARSTLRSVQERGCRLAVLKAKSPSCGNGRIYDGSFTGTLVPGFGVAARLLRSEGVRVLDEVQLQACMAASEARRPGGLPAVLAASSAECPTLVTERFVLRPLERGDMEGVLARCGDPDAGSDAGRSPQRTIDGARFFAEDIACVPHVFGLFERRGCESGGCESGGRELGGCAPCDRQAPRDMREACGPLVGSIGLVPDPSRRNPDCLMLGYALANPATDGDRVSEAVLEMLRYGFDELGLSMITCSRRARNDRARRVVEECGFKLEGVLHACAVAPDGTPQDDALYRLTRGAWEARHAR